MRYGYARVSSKSQDYAGQIAALQAAGCQRIFSEKASGKSTDGRREFEKLKRVLIPGDAVVVTKVDRLARSSRDLSGSANAALSRWAKPGATPQASSVAS